LVRILVDRF